MVSQTLLDPDVVSRNSSLKVTFSVARPSLSNVNLVSRCLRAAEGELKRVKALESETEVYNKN